jgi:hypothetical protein
MRNSETSKRLIFVLIAALATTAAGCGTYGDPCLRTTDCGSGFVCVEGKCQVDLGDDPSDASIGGDAPGASDAPRAGDSTSEGPTRDASTDPSDEGSTPPGDSAGDTRDVGTDRDGAESSVLDVTRDAAELDAPLDTADARAATDIGSGNDGAAGGDVGGDVDSGSVIDATLDAFDAAG